MVTDVTAVLGDAAAVIDPNGDNEEISVLCGLVAWAIEHPDEYDGWDAPTLATALLWNFDVAADEADTMARQFAQD